jgi:GcrA cell cycle regulator
MIATETAAPGAVAASSPALVESTQRCSLLELTHDQCRWPISDPGAVDFAFCGNRTTAGFSYCAGHAHLAYRPASRRRA